MEQDKEATELSRKTYNFKNGITAYQEECTRRQDMQLIPLLKELEIPEMSDIYNMTLIDLAEKIYGSPVLDKILDVILIEPSMKYPDCWQDLKRSELIEVIEDFFTLSPGLTKLFGTGRSEVVTPQDSTQENPDSI